MSVVGSKKIEGFKFEFRTQDFVVTSDVPEKLGGKNEAPDPHNYIEVALAACTAITVQMYANRKQIPLQSTDVKITITKEGRDGNEIFREVSFVGDLTEEQRQSLLTIADKCPIHRFLSTGAKITTEMR